jgi:hypothetical protein
MNPRLDGRSVFLAQLEVAEDNLAKARAALDAVLKPHDTHPLRDSAGSRSVDFGGLVEVAFDHRLEPLEDRIHRLRDKAKRKTSLADLWADLRNYGEEADAVLDECRSFVEGALVRGQGLDHGVCAMADALLEELGENTGIGWKTPTILGRADSYASMAGIIRLEFPELTVWHLPILGHEYGHFVAEQFKRRLLASPDATWEFPILDYISGQSTDGQTTNLLQELFADLFAVHLLGPAFACTAILLRFNPSVPDVDSQTHPSDVKRAHFILHALRAADSGYSKAAGVLECTWVTNRQEAGAAPLDANVAERLDGWLAGLSEKLGVLRRKAHYSTLSSAFQISLALESGKAVADCSLTDALNAAWLCRLRRTGFGKLPDDMEQRVRRLCDEAAACGTRRRRAPKGDARWRT